MNKYVNKCIDLLKSKNNIILQGAPGTGKTYNTAAIALGILGEDKVDLSNHDAVMKRYEELWGKSIFFTTFHQSLDYEDFVEGLKPQIQTNEEGESLGVTYEPEDGIFKRACNAATTDDGEKDIVECIDDFLVKIKGVNNKKLIPTITGGSEFYVWWNGGRTIKCRSSSSTDSREDYAPVCLNVEKVRLQAQGKGIDNQRPQYAQAFIEAIKKEYGVKTNRPVVLIIDEINRGNVSKIFGELITLLEVDKRDNGSHSLRVELPYSKTAFSVPSSLYIIGTMNTTDRSTGVLDYALRRRFAFVTLQSDPAIIKSYYDELNNEELKTKAVNLFKNIKAFIENPDHLSGDFDVDDLMVGHSYFMASSESDLTNRVQFEILPLISEYINDGILSVTSEEKKKAFDAWKNLRVIEKVEKPTEN